MRKVLNDRVLRNSAERGHDCRTFREVKMANEIRWKGRAVYVALGLESESFADRVALIRPPESGLTRESHPASRFPSPA
jgi:hypothetical protein